MKLVGEGDAALIHQRLDAPTPRLALGQALAGVARSGIDVSDGLAGDLGHILSASGVGAEIDLPALPVAPALQTLPEAERLACLLAGGDDYELLFTAAPAAREAVAAAARASGTSATRIGRITEGRGLRLLDAAGQPVTLSARSFDHFA